VFPSPFAVLPPHMLPLPPRRFPPTSRDELRPCQRRRPAAFMDGNFGGAGSAAFGEPEQPGNPAAQPADTAGTRLVWDEARDPLLRLFMGEDLRTG